MTESEIYNTFRGARAVNCAGQIAALSAALIVAGAQAAEPAAAGLQYVMKPFAVENIAAGREEMGKFLDGNPRSSQVIGTLKGYETEIRFVRPQHIGRLGIIPGTWSNWSFPKEMELTINGERTVTMQFSPPQGPGVDLVTADIGQEVSAIRIRITDTHGEGKAPWGGLAAIGEAFVAPIRYSLAEEPLDSSSSELIFDMESTKPGKVPVKVMVGPGLVYDHPELSVREGLGQYIVALANLTPSVDYGLEYGPQNVREITIGYEGFHENHLSLVSVSMRSSNREPEEWFALPQVEKQSRQVGGRTWVKSRISEGAGRFANSTHNGLLVETVGDTKFDSNTSGPGAYWRRQNFYLDIPGLNPAVRSKGDRPWLLKAAGGESGERIDVNWVAMTRRRRLEGGGNLKMVCGVLVPGFILDCDRDMTIASSGGDIPRRSGAPNEGEGRFFGDGRDAARCGPGIVVTSDGVLSGPGSVDLQHLSEPWVVAIWGGLKTPTFWGDLASGLLVTADNGVVAWDGKGIALPAGVCGLSTAFHGLLKDDWKPEDVRARACLLMKMLRTYPIACDEWYAVDKDKVEILDEFSYNRWGPARWQMQDFSPLPTLMSWTRQRFGWPSLPEIRSPVIATPVGPYRWVDGNTIQYSIPIFPAEHAAFPANRRFAEAQDRMSQYVLDMPEPTVKQRNDPPDAWRAIYASMSWPAALLGGSCMNRQARDRLLGVGRQTLSRGISNRCWYKRKELFTGREYVASCWADTTVSPAMFGDTSSCIGTSLYALYVYAKYSGDWQLVRDYWPRAMDIVRYGEVINDWACPLVSSRESTLFGGIDMDTIVFSGLAAARKMAECLGQDDDYERLTYLHAKIYVSFAARMGFQHYLDPEQEDPRMWVNGFSENGPCLDHVCNPGDGVNLDHVSMMLCWQGQEPENYGFLRGDAMPANFLRDFQKDYIETYFSTPDGKKGWRRMPFNQPRTAAHIAARAWIDDWPDEDIQKECHDWVAYYPAAVSSFNAGMWAVVWGRKDGVYLMDWEPARLDGLFYNPQSRQLEIGLDCAQAFRIRLHSPHSIAEVSGGNPGGGVISHRQESRNTHIIDMPKCSGTISVTFGE